MNTTEPNQRAVNVIKGLVMDATRKANSGHPGGPMSSADMAYVLFHEFLRHDPRDPAWFNRDRFVLSAGHESMLLYGLLALVGHLNIQDLQDFRQLGSRTPGHPEEHMTPGVEATTGPLGQGLAMGVGMAVAERMLAARLGTDVVDHSTYVLASDGDMQEPVALGAASLAGHWGLGKLIVFYDSNQIQLSGPTNRSDCTDYRKLFEAFCWDVQEVDGHDHDQIREAIRRAKAETARPTLIIGHTVIAKGTASMEGDFETHGAPLSPDEIKATKRKLGLPEEETFHLPQDALDHFRARFPELAKEVDAWKRHVQKKKTTDAAFARTWDQHVTPPSHRSFTWPELDVTKKVSTRKAFGQCLNELIAQLPNLVGGSADLDPSNQTTKFRDTTGVFGTDNPTGRNLSFGVREFPMGAILNGIALHSGLVGFGATFLVFSDYQRNAVRMSAIQNLPVLHVYTHDSFYVGEDGPTHQPVEHAWSLRLIPNLLVMRPADVVESRIMMEVALTQDKRPSALLFTRQDLPVLAPEAFPQTAKGARRGAYVLHDPADGSPEMLIIATGSEVHLALEAAKMLPDQKIRVVSAPCLELFEEQPQAYKDEILPPRIQKRVAVEAGRSDPWYKYVGLDGIVLGLDHFGDSAPASALAKKYGFTPEHLVSIIQAKYA
ncbi:transketolase [Desulfonatronum sp. SC1]|uniref:transketolase n=1 Tax=Desulfonatronum sp. SC1 TaxID=2109626 RepID=UPI000D2FE726|nr:transketolase [Desulfonatronum sp. SC1]PTN38252.1 transketolase [Desulfonatronum sp. SC1]